MLFILLFWFDLVSSCILTIELFNEIYHYLIKFNWCYFLQIPYFLSFAMMSTTTPPFILNHMFQRWLKMTRSLIWSECRIVYVVVRQSSQIQCGGFLSSDAAMEMAPILRDVMMEVPVDTNNIDNLNISQDNVGSSGNSSNDNSNNNGNSGSKRIIDVCLLLDNICCIYCVYMFIRYKKVLYKWGLSVKCFILYIKCNVCGNFDYTWHIASYLTFYITDLIRKLWCIFVICSGCTRIVYV